MRILITGGAGSVGSELARQLYKDNSVFILDINESGLHDLIVELGISGRVGDIRNKESVHDVFSDFKPEVVYHCAALKHVDQCEKYPEECISTNVNGTLNVINEAKKWECLKKFVFISTDKVNGTSIMGATKRLGERLIRNQGKGFLAIRFGNILGSRGSLFTIWDKQVEKGEPITITDVRMERYLMSISDACELVITASIDNEYGMYILNMGEPVNIMSVAKIYLSSKGLQNYPTDIIGIRPGEVLKEELMTPDEIKLAQSHGKFYCIP